MLCCQRRNRARANLSLCHAAAICTCHHEQRQRCCCTSWHTEGVRIESQRISKTPWVHSACAELRQRCCCTSWHTEGVRIESQRKTPWVDSAYADCPGFLVLAAALLLLSRLPPSSRSLRLFPWASIFCFMGSWTFAWICCPQLLYHPCKNGMHSTCFYKTGGHKPRKGEVSETCLERKKGVLRRLPEAS